MASAALWLLFGSIYSCIASAALHLRTQLRTASWPATWKLCDIVLDAYCERAWKTGVETRILHGGIEQAYMIAWSDALKIYPAWIEVCTRCFAHRSARGLLSTQDIVLDNLTTHTLDDTHTFVWSFLSKTVAFADGSGPNVCC